MALEPKEKNPNQELDDTAYNEWLSRNALPVEVASEEVSVEGQAPVPRRDLGVEVGVVTPKSGFFFGWAKLLIVLLPLLFLAGYYTYTAVSGANFFGVTIRTNVNLENGLVGHWTFDGPDMTTATATDVSGNGNHGTINSAPKPAIGKIGQALTFDGVDDYIDYGDVNSYDGFSQITASLWVKTTNLATEKHFIGKSACNGLPDGGVFELGGGYIAANKPDFTIYKSGGSPSYYQVGSSVDVADGKWHLVTGTYNGSALKIYVDGVETGSTPATSVVMSSISYPFEIGRCNGTYYADALFDDVRLYNRALSAKEVEALYKQGEGSKINVTQTPDNLATGLVGHWTFDGPDMDWASTTAEATDRSGNNNHGNVTNFTNSQASMGKVGQALTFDKVDDYINAGSGANLDDLGPLTASMWIKPRSFGEGDAFGKLIGKDASVTSGSWQLSLLNGTPCIAGGTPTQTASIFFVKTGATGVNAGRCSADNSISLNEWQHITVTWDGLGGGPNYSGVRLYKDGLEMSYTTTNTFAPGITSTDASLELYIGNRPTNDRTYDGEIDDVRLYNRVLSPAEVAQLYSLGAGSTIKICDVESVQDADGGTYNTLAIGSQCWLDRNMNVGTRIAAATTQTNNGTIEKWCYSNSDANCTANNPNKPDGGLYQWNEAMQYSTTEGARGICPVGFHIPTDAEWHKLEKFLLDGGDTCSATREDYGCSPAGTKLQPGGRSHFELNWSGFVAFGIFNSRTSSGPLWTSSESGGSARFRIGDSFDDQVYRGTVVKSHGYSVRCLQD